MVGNLSHSLRQTKKDNSHIVAVKFISLLEEKVMPTEILRGQVGNVISDIEYRKFMDKAADYEFNVPVLS